MSLDLDALESEVLTAQGVASRLGVTERTVRRWIKAGKLPATKQGRVWLIDLAAAQRVAEQNYQAPIGKLPTLLPPKAVLELLLQAARAHPTAGVRPILGVLRWSNAQCARPDSNRCSPGLAFQGSSAELRAHSASRGGAALVHSDGPPNGFPVGPGNRAIRFRPGSGHGLSSCGLHLFLGREPVYAGADLRCPADLALPRPCPPSTQRGGGGMSDARELLSRATARPWRACTWDVMERPHVHKDTEGQRLCSPPDLPLTNEDAELIAWLANNAERLLEIEAAARAYYNVKDGDDWLALGRALSIPEAGPHE